MPHSLLWGHLLQLGSFYGEHKGNDNIDILNVITYA